MKYLKIIVMCLIFIPNIIFAKQISIDEFDIMIDISDDWDVFTRDNLIDNNNLIKYGLTKDEALENMKSNSIYIDAVYGNYEFFLRANHDATIYNLNNYKYSDIHQFAKALIKSSGADNYEIIKNNNIVYIKSKYIDTSLNAYLIEYVTIINKNNITFTLQSYDDYPNDDFEMYVENIIKNASIKVKYENEKSNIWINILYTILISVIVGGLIFGISFLINKRKKESKVILNIDKKEEDKKVQ